MTSEYLLEGVIIFCKVSSTKQCSRGGCRWFALEYNLLKPAQAPGDENKNKTQSSGAQAVSENVFLVLRSLPAHRHVHCHLLTYYFANSPFSFSIFNCGRGY